MYCDLVVDFTQPKLLVTLKETLKFPDCLYTCCGLESDETAPSPKSHCHLLMTPLSALLRSVNLTGKGKHPFVCEAEKSTTGDEYTVMYCAFIIESAPLELCIINLIV